MTSKYEDQTCFFSPIVPRHLSPRAIFMLLLLLTLIYFTVLSLLAPQYQNQRWYFPENTEQLNSRQLIDWTNHSFYAFEIFRTGPGEHGEPVVLTDDDEKLKAEVVIQEYSHNGVVSDKISLDRAIPDNRHPNCTNLTYYADLPAVSVIIIFHNEYLSSLLRTVHSVINRTPDSLLHEVILVDDCSDKEFLKTDLEDHINSYRPNKIKLIRLHERSGLMKARTAGIKASKSDIVVVMDGHIEVETNWLPPLIQPIVEDYRVMTEPIIHAILSNTYEITNTTYIGSRKGFDWGLRFLWLKRYETDNLAENFFNPTFLGAIMAMNKTFFWELDGYDERLQIYGGEQYELSFKVWMCSSGRLVTIPCSVVAHNFKSEGHHPYYQVDLNHTYFLNNIRRVVEVFFDDEYKEFVYTVVGFMKLGSTGDLTKQLELKKRLGCRSFKWYLDNIYPELLQMYPMYIWKEAVAAGRIRNLAFNDHCMVYYEANNTVDIHICDESKIKQRHESFLYMPSREIRAVAPFFMTCIDVGEAMNETRGLIAHSCEDQSGTESFKYDLDTKRIQWNDLCLDVTFSNETNLPLLILRPCTEEQSQQWRWGQVYRKRLAELQL